MICCLVTVYIIIINREDRKRKFIKKSSKIVKKISTEQMAPISIGVERVSLFFEYGKYVFLSSAIIIKSWALC